MDTTRDYDEADKVLTPYGVLRTVLKNEELAVECITALADYLTNYPIGNNQLPAIVFFETYDAVFGCVDIWDESDTEEVM